MHVSLVMTLRATEPLFTLALSTIVFGTDDGLRRLVSLIPVVCGASMSALGSADATLAGAVACAASNACFAARGVLTKVIRARHAADNYSLFLHINVIGALMAGAYVVVAGAAVVLPESMTILVINGVAFWAYLQLSWLVLARVTAVTHSVCNAMRRPVVILAGWLQFGNEITSLNACGIALACGGAALYGHLSRPPPPPPPDRDDEARETLV
jgi:drug/metabolite transporter (DMT)-like permease